MMSNTPRVFVGTTTFLIAGITSGANLQTVIAAINEFPGDEWSLPTNPGWSP